jgi:hypothetical protein
VLLTDGLWPDDPLPLVRAAAANAARFVCVQLLDPWELEPTPDGAMTLVDCELGTRASLRLDATALRVYGERLARLCETLRDGVLAVGGSFVRVAAGELSTICRRDLVPAGVLVPA